MSMAATVGLEELHSAEAVTSCVLLSLKVPVAVNCRVVPIAMLAFAGVTAMETRLAPVTVRDAVPLTEPEAAVIVTGPVPTAAAIPEALMDATFVAEEDQVTDVSNCVLPSSKVPTAVNCCAVPCATELVAGVTSIEIRFAGTTVNVVVSLKEPKVEVRVACAAPAVGASPVLSTVATEVEEEVHVSPLTRSCEEPSL